MARTGSPSAPHATLALELVPSSTPCGHPQALSKANAAYAAERLGLPATPHLPQNWEPGAGLAPQLRQKGESATMLTLMASAEEVLDEAPLFFIFCTTAPTMTKKTTTAKPTAHPMPNAAPIYFGEKQSCQCSCI